jgi:hypothetical protein
MHPLRGRQVPPNKLSGSRAERQKKNDQTAKVSQPFMRSATIRETMAGCCAMNLTQINPVT